MCDDSTLHCTTVYCVAMLVLVVVSPLLLAALAAASTLHVVDIQPEPTAVRMAVLACQGLINRQVSIDHIQHLDSIDCYRRMVRRRCSR